MVPEVGTQNGGLPNRKYICLSLYHGLFNGDTLNPFPCYRKSEHKMAAAQTVNTYNSVH